MATFKKAMGAFRSSGNTKHQVSAGVKKRFSQMTQAELTRVADAGWATLLDMPLPEGSRTRALFEEMAKESPEWVVKVRQAAADVNAIEGEK
jgi:hypothetical protein